MVTACRRDSPFAPKPMMYARALRASSGRWAAPLLVAVFAGCSTQEGIAPDLTEHPADRSDLEVTYRFPTQTAVPGTRIEQLGGSRRFVVYVPSNYTPETSWPVALLLHGSGDRGSTMIQALSQVAEEQGVVLVAPDANRYTWDLILGNVGSDVDYIEQVIGWTFDHVNVDLSRFTIGGFSDGATYSAWLGLLNGDVFSQIVVMSGCLRFPDVRVGHPRVLMLHGNADEVFIPGGCVPLLLPGLQDAGYDVQYIEFEGRHEISTEFSRRMMEFVAGH